MHTLSRATHSFCVGTLIALTAALLLFTAVSTATAGRLSISNQSIRVAWSELTFSESLRCQVTLEGSLHSRTITKVRGSLIGHINTVTVAHPCRTGELWMDNGVETFLGRRTLQTLPWHLTYERFLGTLPNISGLEILLRNVSFLINVGGGLCLARYAVPNLGLLLEVRNGVLGRLNPTPGNNIATLREMLGGIFCPATGGLTGAATVTLTGTATPITVTLI